MAENMMEVCSNDGFIEDETKAKEILMRAFEFIKVQHSLSLPLNSEDRWTYDTKIFESHITCQFYHLLVNGFHGLSKTRVLKICSANFDKIKPFEKDFTKDFEGKSLADQFAYMKSVFAKESADIKQKSLPIFTGKVSYASDPELFVELAILSSYELYIVQRYIKNAEVEYIPPKETKYVNYLLGRLKGPIITSGRLSDGTFCFETKLRGHLLGYENDNVYYDKICLNWVNQDKINVSRTIKIKEEDEDGTNYPMVPSTKSNKRTRYS